MNASPAAPHPPISSSIALQRRVSARQPRGRASAIEPRLERARAALVRVGMRVTHPRLLVLSLFLAGGVGAMAADKVVRALYQRGDTLSLSTVYTALRHLDEARLIVSHYEDGRRLYEEAGSRPPARVVCDVCGTERILRDARLDTLLRQVIDEAGFMCNDYRLLVSVSCAGECSGCRAQNHRKW